MAAVREVYLIMPLDRWEEVVVEEQELMPTLPEKEQTAKDFLEDLRIP
jgi:hypothetical protein